MTHLSYTQNTLVKNPNELLKNKEILQNSLVQGYEDIQINPEKLATNEPKHQIIVPGFINLHAHLVYSNYSIKPSSLFKWLIDLVEKNPGQSKKQVIQSCLDGAKEALSYGTTYLVDNSSHIEETILALKDTGLKAILGLELFGSDEKYAESIFQKQIEILEQAQKLIKQENLEKQIELCLSPHASYDVSPKLWQLCLEWSKQNQKKLLTHIAESKSEENWFKYGDSSQAEDAISFWKKIGSFEAKKNTWKKYQGSIDYLNQNHMLNESIVAAHMVQATEDDLKIVKEKNISLVSCPRSNEYLENGLPNYHLWESMKLLYGIGTDSKASNYNLDLRQEVNKIPGISARRKLELLTTDAARILNKEKEIGSLDIGKAADYTVFEVVKDLDMDQIDPLEVLFDTEVCKVKEVFIDGKLAFNIN